MNDNLIGREYPDGSRVTFVFDSLGQTTTMEDSTGSYTSTYDSISRKTTVTNPANKTITYAYDALGQRSSMIEPDGGRFTYSYNADGQLETLVNPQSDRTTYSYNAQGRRESILLANGTRTSFAYDANSQMANVIHRKSDNTVINSFAYNYDAAGNRTNITEASGDRTTYTYDATNQIASEHRTGSNAHRTTFTYDDSGNRIKKEKDAVLTRFEYDVANQLTVQINAGGRTTYTFDAAGNQEVVLEPNSDLTTTTWNYENQPTLYEKPTNALVTMTYNPDNRRVCKESAAVKSNFVWDVESDNVLLETDDFDVTQVVYTNEPEEFGSLVSQRRGSATNWFCFDALGSTNNLTNSSETITDSYVYDAWGNKLSSSGSTVNPFQYVGQLGYYYDEETGSNYIRARVYQPTTARWWSTDPLEFIDGLNLYLYVRNHPMDYIDDSGLAPRKCTTKECDKCVKDARKNDKKIKAIDKLLRQKIFTTLYKPGCTPDITCKKKCLSPQDFGAYDTKAKKIRLCANNLYYFPKAQGNKRIPCEAVVETLRHELIHQYTHCNSLIVGGKTDCEKCICDEINAYRVSGQCNKGSVWRDVVMKGKFDKKVKKGLEKTVCLLLSAVESCGGFCAITGKNDKEKIKMSHDASKNCAVTVLGKSKKGKGK